MSTQESLQVVKDGYAAFGRGDIAALLALMSVDVEWVAPGNGMPLSGTYLGPNGVATFFQKLNQETEILAFEAREFVADGDRVAVIGWERARVKSTNRTVELNWVMTFEVSDGKIVKFREYTDTQAMAGAYESTARAAGATAAV